MKKVIDSVFKSLSAIICIMLFTTAATAQMTSPGATVKDSKSAVMKEAGNVEEPNIWEVFYKRRSVRKFKSDPVPEAEIRKIIDAARMAPTSGNQQPWKFLVIRDRNVINQMMDECVKESLARFDANMNNNETRTQFEDRIRKALSSGYFSAPVFIVILTDNNSKYPDYNHWDGPLAAGYLMLAARALGYGTVFITDAIPESVTKTVLQIPDNYTRVCITPLGVPYDWPATPPKKDLNEMISFDKL
jgi:nitroreductase